LKIPKNPYELPVEDVALIVHVARANLAVALARGSAKDQGNLGVIEMGESFRLSSPLCRTFPAEMRDIPFEQRDIREVLPVRLGRESVPFDRGNDVEAREPDPLAESAAPREEADGRWRPSFLPWGPGAIGGRTGLDPGHVVGDVHGQELYPTGHSDVATVLPADWLAENLRLHGSPAIRTVWPMTDLSKRFGDVVARTRRRRGLSQERLGELSGLHRDTVRRVENNKGSKDGPTLDTIERLARGMEMYPSDLLAMADGSETPDEDDQD
jgi:DNA-binding XRE family transcriptional regulator